MGATVVPGRARRRPSVRGLTRAAMPLLVGSVCAQLLLNGLPVLVVAEAGEANEAAAGVFVAAFTLAKAPLSMVVPLQSAVVPTLTRLIAAGRRREVVVLLVKGVALLAAVAAIGVPLAFWWAPGGVARLRCRLHDRRPGPRDHPLRGARPHRARRRHPGPRRPGRHRDVALSWTAGLLAAGITFWLVPGVILSGEVAFGVGSAVGAVVSALILAASRRRPAEERSEA